MSEKQQWFIVLEAHILLSILNCSNPVPCIMVSANSRGIVWSVRNLSLRIIPDSIFDVPYPSCIRYTQTQYTNNHRATVEGEGRWASVPQCHWKIPRWTSVRHIMCGIDNCLYKHITFGQSVSYFPQLTNKLATVPSPWHPEHYNMNSSSIASPHWHISLLWVSGPDCVVMSQPRANALALFTQQISYLSSRKYRQPVCRDRALSPNTFCQTL